MLTTFRVSASGTCRSRSEIDPSSMGYDTTVKGLRV